MAVNLFRELYHQDSRQEKILDEFDLESHELTVESSKKTFDTLIEGCKDKPESSKEKSETFMLFIQKIDKRVAILQRDLPTLRRLKSHVLIPMHIR